MQAVASLLNRELQIHISARAEKQLQQRSTPLCLEMELYFSCMIRKRVLVREQIHSEFRAEVGDKLHIGFRPVMTRACGITETAEDGKPPLTDFPIKKPQSYIPNWLTLDYRKGEWCAEFGYIDEDMPRVG